MLLYNCVFSSTTKTFTDHRLTRYMGLNQQRMYAGGRYGSSNTIRIHLLDAIHIHRHHSMNVKFPTLCFSHTNLAKNSDEVYRLIVPQVFFKSLRITIWMVNESSFRNFVPQQVRGGDREIWDFFGHSQNWMECWVWAFRGKRSQKVVGCSTWPKSWPELPSCFNSQSPNSIYHTILRVPEMGPIVVSRRRSLSCGER